MLCTAGQRSAGAVPCPHFSSEFRRIIVVALPFTRYKSEVSSWSEAERVIAAAVLFQIHVIFAWSFRHLKQWTTANELYVIFCAFQVTLIFFSLKSWKQNRYHIVASEWLSQLFRQQWLSQWLWGEKNIQREVKHYPKWSRKRYYVTRGSLSKGGRGASAWAR